MLSRQIRRILGICHPIIDLNVSLNEREFEDLARDGVALGFGVQFPPEANFREVRRALLRRYAHRVEWNPGGPVSNTLHGIGTRLGGYPRSISLEWVGPYSPGIDFCADHPLDSLRSVGIETTCAGSSSRLSESICVTEAESGETVAVLVGPRQTFPDGFTISAAASDLVIVRIAELPQALRILSPRSAPQFAVVTADHARLSAVELDAIRLVALSGQLRYVLGRLPEMVALGFLHAVDGSADPMLSAAELVVTNTAEPVAIYPAGATRELYDVGLLAESRRSLLGSGDAYAAGYLAARLQGGTRAESHAGGLSQSRLVSYSSSARRSYSANLTELFGEHIGRASQSPDWDLRTRVRQSSGLTVITCGQSGVDQLALAAASKYGLASYAVLPSGRRTERSDGAIGEADNFAHAYLLELGSASYRYCTWANVFLADGSLIFDPVGSEGSEETRAACRALNRPFLDLAVLASQDLRPAVSAFVQRNGIRVLHVAGNRASLLGFEEMRAADQVIAASLRFAATCLAPRERVSTSVESTRESNVGLGQRTSRLGVPRLREVRDAIAEVADVEGLFAGQRLSGSIGPVDLCLARSADLVKMLNAGRLDAALVGSDMVLEYGNGDTEIVGYSGLFNVVIGLLAREDDSWPPETLVAQYPRLASRLLSDRVPAITQVAGASEGWVAVGAFDGAVDSWRTGATANENGLVLREVLESTTLCLAVSRRRAYSPAASLGASILNALAGTGALY